MARRRIKDAGEYIKPLNMNGLRGRMLRIPPTKNKQREILLIYGHHASIERMMGMAEDLSQYGGVTMPDLPGFGGMQSFYRIEEKPTLDNLADYLAAFIKLQYKRKKVTIIGMSFGFVVITKMLQKYPELSKKVNLLVSVVGFAHREDFRFKRRTYWLFRLGASFCSGLIMSKFVRYIALQPVFIRNTYRLVADKHSKLHDASTEERNRRIDFEIELWHINDVRTYMATTVSMLKLDLCGQQVDLPVYHVEVAEDRYFDNRIVEQHLAIIYSDVHMIKSKMANHAPTVVADAKSAAPFVPAKIRSLLSADPV